MTNEYNQPNLDKVTDPEIARVLQSILQLQRDIIDRIGVSEKAFTEHLSKAFPTGDPDGHRRYHELQIEMLAEKRRLRIAIQEKTLSGLAWSFILFLGYATWEQIVRKISGGVIDLRKVLKAHVISTECYRLGIAPGAMTPAQLQAIRARIAAIYKAL